MSAVFGLVDSRGAGAGPLPLDGVRAVLEPFGRAEHWSGHAGRCEVTLGAMMHSRKPEHRSLAVDAATGVTVCTDAVLHESRQLASRLGLPTTASTAEVALAAYRRWGERLTDHLDGAFVLVIADARRGGVLLVRDHVGDRFVAYHQREAVVAFATTALALTAFPGVGHELDMQRFAEVVSLSYCTDRTFVAGVRSLPPGTAAWIDDAGIRSWRWWRPESIAVRDAGSLEAHATALRTALEKSVASSMKGADSIGVLLSGGLDSSSVAAVAAAQLAPVPLHTYTSVPPPRWEGPVQRGWIADERFAVEALAERVPNLRPHFVHVKGNSPLAYHETLWELGAGPIRNSLNLMWFYECMQEAFVDGVDVLLMAGHGNFAFSADGKMWLVELLQRARFARLVSEVRAWSEFGQWRPINVVRRDLIAHLVPYPIRRWRQKRMGNPDLLDEHISATAIHPERSDSLDFDTLVPTRTRPHPRDFTRDLTRYFADSGAQSEALAAERALFGIDLRDPLANRGLIELALQQPDYWRRHAGTPRAICRAAMRDVLPPEVVDRTTLGEQLPDWFDRLTDAREEVRREVKEMGDHPASRDVIDVAKLERLVENWPDREGAAEQGQIYDYKLALGRAMVISRYVRWFEDRARRVAAGGPPVIVTRPWET